MAGDRVIYPQKSEIRISKSETVRLAEALSRQANPKSAVIASHWVLPRRGNLKIYNNDGLPRRKPHSSQ